MTTPELTPLRRAAIRQRARSIRRRRRVTVASATVLALIGAGGVVTVLDHGSPNSTKVVITPSPSPAVSCPAAAVAVPVHIGERAVFGLLPAGWVITAGNPLALDQPVGYAAPSTDRPSDIPPGASYTAPSLYLQRSFDAPTGSTVAAGPQPGLTRTTVTIGAITGTETVMPDQGQPPSASFPQTVDITWRPDPRVSLSLSGTNVGPPEMLAIARALRYSPGSVANLPERPTATISKRTAVKALPATARRVGRAALTTWAEAARLANRDRATRGSNTTNTTATGGEFDYRAVWLVSAPTGVEGVVWDIVDATSDVVLQRGDGASPWIDSVTDRSQAGCEPPAGVLTRSEVTALVSGEPGPPAGITFDLLARATAESLLSAQDSTNPALCYVECSDLVVWASSTVAAPYTFAIYSALDAGPISERSGGNQPIAVPPGADLAPGPTPASAEPPTPSRPGRAAAVTNPPTTPTSVPLVGASPYYPGTTEPRPAPAGNGHGPDGSCDGTETTPPCGPGAVVGEYYPYTLIESCNGEERFDGRTWIQGLIPAVPAGTTTYQNVWMLLSGPGQAGWVGPGGVGMTLAPTQPPVCSNNPSTATVAPLAPPST